MPFVDCRSQETPPLVRMPFLLLQETLSSDRILLGDELSTLQEVGLGERPNHDAKAHFTDRFARRLASSWRSASQSAFDNSRPEPDRVASTRRASRCSWV